MQTMYALPGRHAQCQQQQQVHIASMQHYSHLCVVSSYHFICLCSMQQPTVQHAADALSCCPLCWFLQAFSVSQQTHTELPAAVCSGFQARLS
jgi:hypothetical protein